MIDELEPQTLAAPSTRSGHGGGQMNPVPIFLQVLGLNESADEHAIRRAYARKIAQVDKRRDPASVQRLRAAYEAASDWFRALDAQMELQLDPGVEPLAAATPVLKPAAARATLPSTGAPLIEASKMLRDPAIDALTELRLVQASAPVLTAVPAVEMLRRETLTASAPEDGQAAPASAAAAAIATAAQAVRAVETSSATPLVPQARPSIPAPPGESVPQAALPPTGSTAATTAAPMAAMQPASTDIVPAALPSKTEPGDAGVAPPVQADTVVSGPAGARHQPAPDSAATPPVVTRDHEDSDTAADAPANFSARGSAASATTDADPGEAADFSAGDISTPAASVMPAQSARLRTLRKWSGWRLRMPMSQPAGRSPVNADIDTDTDELPNIRPGLAGLKSWLKSQAGKNSFSARSSAMLAAALACAVLTAVVLRGALQTRTPATAPAAGAVVAGTRLPSFHLLSLPVAASAAPWQASGSGLPPMENRGLRHLAFLPLLAPIEPAYPQRALELRQQGRVSIRAYVNEAGQVREARVERSSRFDSLDQAAEAAVWQARFQPYVEDGRAVPVSILVHLRFRLPRK